MLPSSVESIQARRVSLPLAARCRFLPAWFTCIYSY